MFLNTSFHKDVARTTTILTYSVNSSDLELRPSFYNLHKANRIECCLFFTRKPSCR